jgi:hypothetical protein
METIIAAFQAPSTSLSHMSSYRLNLYSLATNSVVKSTKKSLVGFCMKANQLTNSIKLGTTQEATRY